MSQPCVTVSMITMLAASLSACVDAPAGGDRLAPRSANASGGKADGERLLSVCATDAELIAGAAAYVDRYLMPGSNLVARTAETGGRVERTDLDRDGVDEVIITTNHEYDDSEWGVTERGILALTTIPGFDACTGFAIGLWLGVGAAPAEDAEDLGEEGFAAMDIERGGPWCQFDTYRVAGGFYEFVVTRDGCEPPDEL